MKNIFNMYNEDGTLNNDYMKGMLITNKATKTNFDIGVVVGFYQATEDNQTHAGLRFFTVRVNTLDGETKNVTWWYDKQNGSYNTNVRIITPEEAFKI